MIAFANETTSAFNEMRNMLRDNGGYNTIAVTEMDEKTEFNTFVRKHHIYVAVEKETILHYTFISGKGNDYLERIEVLNQTFEQTILEVWKKVRADGQCSMTISPY